MEKVIKGFPDYTVNELGDVFSYKSGQRYILKKQDDGRGYFKVKLCNYGHIKHIPIHRLVALHHVPNTSNKPCVNHIDGDKLNNAASNLEWVTVAENNKHAREMGLIKKKSGPLNEKHWQTTLTTSDVIYMRKHLFGNMPLRHIAKKYNMSHSSIAKIRDRITWKNI